MQVLAAALRTRPRHRPLVSAVMALQLVRALVIGERDGAVVALDLLAARAAQHDGGISAAVQQDHRLLAALETRRDLFRQLAREQMVFTRLRKLDLHVY